MRKLVLVLATVVIFIILFIGFGLILSHAGEKEEVRAKLMAVLQEERAMNAEFQLYQAKMGELQRRFPEMQKEKEALQKQLKEMEEKEIKEKKPEIPAPKKQG